MGKKRWEEVSIKVRFDSVELDEDTVVGEVEEFLESNFGHEVAHVRHDNEFKTDLEEDDEVLE